MILPLDKHISILTLQNSPSALQVDVNPREITKYLNPLGSHGEEITLTPYIDLPIQLTIELLYMMC